MHSDEFADLRDWGKVMIAIERLRSEKMLDERQGALSRLLRYRENWRLREEALKCALEIQQSNDVLIAEVLNVLVETEGDLGLRCLAAKALGHLLPRRPEQSSSVFDPDKVRRTLVDMLDQPEAPVLRDAIDDALRATKTK